MTHLISNLERFNSRFTVNATTGCWEWDHPVKNRGYGSFDLGGRTMGAHIASWRLNKGEIGVGLCVLHKCDNRACVNPDHLYLGTKKDNRRDFMERHPRAKEIVEIGQRAGRAGLKRFWANMTAEERHVFSVKRAQKQWDGNGGVHPAWGVPIERPKI